MSAFLTALLALSPVLVAAAVIAATAWFVTRFATWAKDAIDRQVVEALAEDAAVFDLPATDASDADMDAWVNTVLLPAFRDPMFPPIYTDVQAELLRAELEGDDAVTRLIGGVA